MCVRVCMCVLCVHVYVVCVVCACVCARVLCVFGSISTHFSSKNFL